MSDNILTQERLKELLSYDPETGVFVWVNALGTAKIGDVAGCSHSEGYRVISIDRKLYFAHRLAWLYMAGTFPPDQIDHINRIRNDNRFANLRAVTKSENMHNSCRGKNNNSGFKGASYDKFRKNWRAHIKINNVTKCLGRFSTPEEAGAAYLAAQRIYHPSVPGL